MLAWAQPPWAESSAQLLVVSPGLAAPSEPSCQSSLAAVLVSSELVASHSPQNCSLEAQGLERLPPPLAETMKVPVVQEQPPHPPPFWLDEPSIPVRGDAPHKHGRCG